jgi:hypothetical protein
VSENLPDRLTRARQKRQETRSALGGGPRKAMHRLCGPSCAHGMSLPTGSTPAHTRDQSKLHTTHPANHACALWSPHAIVLGQTTQRTTAGDKGLARGTCSQNEKRLETEEDRWCGPLPHAPRQPQRTLAYACHPRRSSCEACACAHHGVWMALPRMPSASTHGAQAIQNIVRRLGVREGTVQVCQGMQQRDGLLRPRRDEGGVRGQAAPYRRPGRPRS